MQKFIFGLIATAILAQIPVPSQAGSVNAIATLDLRNKSDQCVWWNIPNKDRLQGEVGPGQSTVISIMVASYSSSSRINAKIVNCGNHQLIVERYDYVPISGRSELSVHKQGNTYIMRHGP
ncbi:MAG: hypothetical protein WBD74_01320 [Candidatus Aquilonibacter sp.]